MKRSIPLRAVLMSLNIEESGKGFHRVTYKVDGGRNGAHRVTVMISADAYRKLATQLSRLGVSRVEASSLVQEWAKWAVAERVDLGAEIPDTMTITASDVDDLGAYAAGFASAIGAR